MQWLKQLLCRHIDSPLGKAIAFKQVGMSNRLTRNIEVQASECNKCGKLRAKINIKSFSYNASDSKYLGMTDLFEESDER